MKKIVPMRTNIVISMITAFLIILASIWLMPLKANEISNNNRIEESEYIHYYLERSWIKGESDLEKVRSFFNNMNYKVLTSELMETVSSSTYRVYLWEKNTKKLQYASVIFDSPMSFIGKGNCLEPAPGTIKEDKNGMPCTPFGALRYFH